MPCYQIWNVAICNQFFSESRCGHTVFLTTDSESLRQCLQEQTGEDDFDSESDAVNDFVDAVLHEYQRRHCRWRILEETCEGEIPDYVAFLAAEILAAFNVGDSDEIVDDTGDSFWRSFRDLFGEAANHSPQFYGDQVEAWNDLVQWANVRNGRRNGCFQIPEIERRQGNRWFVNLPYSQCLLRVTDLERLTGFFAEFGLRPDDAHDRPRVTRLVQSCLHDCRWFTRHAQRVLQSDDRWTDAFNQIVEYLRDWDGNVRSAGLLANHSIRKTEISVEKHSRTSRLDFRLFDTEKENATGRLTNDQIKDLFGIGVFQRLSLNGLKYRPRAKHYLLAVEHAAINRFLTVNRVRPGERFRLIVHLNNRRQWQKGIYQVCEDDSVHIFCSSQRQEHGIDGFLSGLPTDWILMEGRCRSELHNVPDPWQSILDERSPRICAVGGLKLTRNEWQAEAGPRILVSGSTLPSKLLIDDVEVSIPPSGFVTHSLLDSPGFHAVSIGNSERRCRGLRVCVRESTLSPPLNECSGWTSENAGWPSVTIATHDASSNSVVGMSVGGAWGKCDKSNANTLSGPIESAQRSMIQLLLSNRSSSRTGKTDSMHPLVRLIASRRVLGASKCKPGTKAK
jgi:hypothetical protein